MPWIVLAVILLLVPVIAFLWYFRKILIALASEPVLRRPVVIFESDDWGPAEAWEAERLRDIAGILARFRDADGRHPVMTLGIVLTVPDTEGLRNSGLARFRSRRLDEPIFSAVRDTMLGGFKQGVFALQLHGMAHYLPETLQKAARENERIRDWLTSEGGVPDPIDLPPELQSRWVDGSGLPTQSLPRHFCEREASEEVDAFRQVFDLQPAVAVPPTFVWTDAVEKGWAREGIRYVVSPGGRNEARDSQGRPVAEAQRIWNGRRSTSSGVSYVVRDLYFEPSYGHKAWTVLSGVMMHCRLGRPALLEIHRFNFNRDRSEHEAALRELERFLTELLVRVPNVAFLSTEALGKVLTRRDPEWVETSWWKKIPVFWLRVRRDMPLIRRLFPLGEAV